MTTEGRQLGNDAEERAALLLQAAGLRIVARNYLCRLGELDIVACNERLLVIAEVRLRSSARFGGGAASITWRKQRRIVRATRHLLSSRRELAALPVRFDAVIATSIDAPLEWIRGAFEVREV